VFPCRGGLYLLSPRAEKTATDYRCAIHAYVLMTNHAHLLATPETPEELSRLMRLEEA
jgi:putative transposase